MSLASIQPGRASYDIKVVDSKTVFVFKRPKTLESDDSHTVESSAGSNVSGVSATVSVPFGLQTSVATTDSADVAHDYVDLCDSDDDGSGDNTRSEYDPLAPTMVVNTDDPSDACVVEELTPTITTTTDAVARTGSTVANTATTTTPPATTSTALQSITTIVSTNTRIAQLNIYTQTIDVATNDVAVSAVCHTKSASTNTDHPPITNSTPINATITTTTTTNSSNTHNTVTTIDTAISSMTSALSHTTDEELQARNIDPVAFRALASAMNDMCKRKRGV